MSSPKTWLSDISTIWNKMAISKFDWMNFGGKGVGGGLVALQFFVHLKKGARTFNFSLNEPPFF